MQHSWVSLTRLVQNIQKWRDFAAAQTLQGVMTNDDDDDDDDDDNDDDDDVMMNLR